MQLPAPNPPEIPDRDDVNMAWLVRVRWGEIIGQSVTVLLAAMLTLKIPILALSLVIFVGALSNLALQAWFGVTLRSVGKRRGVKQWQLAGVMALDVVLLTCHLYLTGGSTNPFVFLYVVQIALATVVLEAVMTWALVALSFIGFGVLIVDHQPLDMSKQLHAVGMWVALGVSSAFVVHFLLRITSALQKRERELEESRNLTNRQQRLASLATMAAGAAHELATPLGTIALVARELELSLQKRGDANSVEDALLIRDQAARCRMILDQMAGGASTTGEFVEASELGALLDEALLGVRLSPKVELAISADDRKQRVSMPRRAVVQTLRSLITNAQDASPAERPVQVRVTVTAPWLVVDIVDRGNGIPHEMIERLGEPFFTTKPPGSGMGLGLFLAQSVVASVGGALNFSSVTDLGTTAQMKIPLFIGAVQSAPEQNTGVNNGRNVAGDTQSSSHS